MLRIRSVVLAALGLAVTASGVRAGAEVLGPACPAGALRIVAGEPPAAGPCVPFRQLPSRELRQAARTLERQVEGCGSGGVVLRMTERRGFELGCRTSV